MTCWISKEVADYREIQDPYAVETEEEFKEIQEAQAIFHGNLLILEFHKYKHCLN
ncbi:hypothetical protein [Larkinella rosea]|uniref:hypothetical protein n=1 Tax=Larkinella rosea TaxID=2025312 RepID=UPI001C88F773|nr:hypothetical protein [Larkinella rosea]